MPMVTNVESTLAKQKLDFYTCSFGINFNFPNTSIAVECPLRVYF